jgi:hypothetical protein
MTRVNIIRCFTLIARAFLLIAAIVAGIVPR